MWGMTNQGIGYLRLRGGSRGWRWGFGEGLRGAGGVLDAGRFGGRRGLDGGIAGERLRIEARSVLDAWLGLLLLAFANYVLDGLVVFLRDAGGLRLLGVEDLRVALALSGGRADLSLCRLGLSRLRGLLRCARSCASPGRASASLGGCGGCVGGLTCGG